VDTNILGDFVNNSRSMASLSHVGVYFEVIDWIS
jgi:hypothetical protein